MKHENYKNKPNKQYKYIQNIENSIDVSLIKTHSGAHILLRILSATFSLF